MSVFLPDKFSESQAPKHSHRQMTIERRFVPLSASGKEDRSEQVRGLLLTGALRLLQAKCNPKICSVIESTDGRPQSQVGGCK